MSIHIYSREEVTVQPTVESTNYAHYAPAKK